MPHRMVRTGCASGFRGDSSAAAPQLLADRVDYIAFDFLAEITMSILANGRRGIAVPKTFAARHASETTAAL